MDKPAPLHCYLLREDGEFYDLGYAYRWHAAFACFDGSADGKTYLRLEDEHLLALRLQEPDFDLPTCEHIAKDIIAWAYNPKSAFLRWVKFVSELSPEIEPDVAPSPLTGSWQNARAK